MEADATNPEREDDLELTEDPEAGDAAENVRGGTFSIGGPGGPDGGGHLA